MGNFSFLLSYFCLSSDHPLHGSLKKTKIVLSKISYSSRSVHRGREGLPSPPTPPAAEAGSHATGPATASPPSHRPGPGTGAETKAAQDAYSKNYTPVLENIPCSQKGRLTTITMLSPDTDLQSQRNFLRTFLLPFSSFFFYRIDKLTLKFIWRDFLDGPEAKTPCSHGREPKFDP